ncbi:unnamed protein product [Protopolystoma xenopodis]|uniref:Uncharacterized protein n=1 Tax=Protopolystoma xenopodis TaxID=117903 RepID=A0A3S5CKK2_9PLAT|nr:unnamed protein product [Protopolystoma xenopodis]
MVSGSDDVLPSMDESSARSHQGLKTVGRGLLRTIQQTKVQGNLVRTIYESLRPPFLNEMKGTPVASSQHCYQTELHIILVFISTI